MRLLGLKVAIIVVGASAVVAVPTMMVLRSNPTASMAPAASPLAQVAPDEEDVQVPRAKRITLAKGTPTPASAAARTATNAGNLAPAASVAVPPPPEGALADGVLHAFGLSP